MKVFEVIFEYEQDKEIIKSVEYWEANNFKSACDHATKHAEEYEKEVLQVRYVLTVVQTVPYADSWYPQEED